MDRKCTDVICCIIFLAFLVIMIGLGFYGIKNGDPYNILTPFDTAGNRCGAPGQGAGGALDLTEYPLKYFSNFGYSNRTAGLGARAFTKKELFMSVCVSECPAQGDTADCKTNSTSCPVAILATASQHKYCLPTSDSIIGAVE